MEFSASATLENDNVDQKMEQKPSLTQLGDIKACNSIPQITLRDKWLRQKVCCACVFRGSERSATGKKVLTSKFRVSVELGDGGGRRCSSA